jgi:hypothetical protein
MIIILNPFGIDGISGVQIAAEADTFDDPAILAEALIRIGGKPMARRPKHSEPLYWADVKSDDGTVLGSYAVDRGIIIVRSATGWEKKTHSSAGGSNEGLARLILSEGPPTQWG